jgi:5'(3')-deoxyribonucleotidase
MSIVLLDCDGVLSAFTDAYLNAVYQETGELHLAREVDRWSIAACPFFVRLANLHPMLKKRCDARVCEPGFASSMKVLPGAIGGVLNLQRAGHDVRVVTAAWDSSPTWMHERTDWVSKHFDIPKKHVIHAACKDLVFGNVFVDDKYSNLLDWSERWPDEDAILWQTHSNASQLNSDIYQTCNWDDVLEVACARRV